MIRKSRLEGILLEMSRRVARRMLPLLCALSGCGGASAAPGTSSSSAPQIASVQTPAAPSPSTATNTAASAPARAAPRIAPSPATVRPAHPVPAAFRVSQGAPSDAEVRAELAQMQQVQRQRKLSASAASVQALLPWTQEPKSGEVVSIASVFRDYNLGLACGGLLGRTQLGVAHKTAPCGTQITFTYGGRSLTVPVIDRGPYIVGREWDLTGATADALGFPGLGPIKWAVAR